MTGWERPLFREPSVQYFIDQLAGPLDGDLQLIQGGHDGAVVRHRSDFVLHAARVVAHVARADAQPGPLEVAGQNAHLRPIFRFGCGT